MTSWSELPLTEEHAAYLRDTAGISPAVAAAAGIRSASTVAELPEHAQSWGDDAVPAIVFPWRTPTGDTVEQVRPDRPVIWKGEAHKYLWPRGTSSVLNTGRADDTADTVLIVEGTKQTFCAASWAPDGIAVYGVGGCRNWSTDGIPLADLAVVEDRRVVIALDADSATNLDVYTAGLTLGQAVLAEGATAVTYLRLPAGGSSGLDDVLAKRAEDKRTAYLARLIEQAKSKPADAKPKPKKAARSGASVVAAAPADRVMIYVDGDRLQVINDMTRTLLERWNARRLFNHGEVISQLVPSQRLGQEVLDMKPLTKGVFLDLLQETAATVRRAGNDGEQVVYCWPDTQSVDAVMSRTGRFAPLDRIARTPFVRKDGSICQVNGYDESSRTMVVMDDAMTGIDVPDEPTAEELASAVKLITEDWLVDLLAIMPTQADKTNAIAMILTPFVRGLMDVVPLAVVDGLQMGVGKNLLADMLAITATGEKLEPLPWSQDDEETRKVITSTFRSGTDVFVFDEAHHLQGAALARALTSATWRDRQLGVSQMLGFPNQVTWVALGNQVRVEGDITRRVYQIALKPTGPDPQNRPASAFRHPDLRGWTQEHRTDLVAALLTVIRAWFADGQPAAAKEVSFGSFEKWERIVGGILAHAGMGDFLGNMTKWRSESSFETGYWNAHIAWLLHTFGHATEFTCAQARKAMAEDPHSETPPGLTDLTEDPRNYHRKLGVAYAGKADRYFDGIQLVKAETGKHTGVSAWLVLAPSEPTKNEPGSEGGFSDTPAEVTADSEGDGGSGGSSPPNVCEKKRVTTRDESPRDYSPEEHARFCVGEVAGSAPSAPSAPLPTSASASEDVLTPTDSGELFAAVPAPYTRVDIDTLDAFGETTLPEGVLALDIETSSEAELFRQGSEFVRLCGYQTDQLITITTDGAELAEQVQHARMVVGHNLMAFDLVALARHHGIDLIALAAAGRVFDTKLAAILNDPPSPGSGQSQIQRDYSLDNLGARILGSTKTGDLKALAAEFGGFDKIPTDDERYVRYLIGDVDLTARLARELKTSDYIRREHRVAAIAARIRMNGFRVDVAELHRRVEANRADRARHLATLTEKYGLPSTKADGKTSKSPHATREGKTAIVRAFADLGVELTNTPNGQPSFGKAALEKVVEQHAGDPAVMALVDTVSSLNGVRTVFETVQQYLVGDRVHPEIGMFQASGRWSTVKPGLTVMGKRGGKHTEREVFIPEDGHAIISADLSQVDARAIAALSQDEAYLAMFSPGIDLHREVAARVWGDPERREDAKALGHGWNYGMGVAGLARNAKVDEDVAREFDRGMREQFPTLVSWRDGVRLAAQVGEMLDNGFGRPMRCDPDRSWTQAPALMGQGCARDLMMEGLLRLPAEILPMLRAVIHDEVVLSVPLDVIDEVEAAVLNALSFPWAPHGARHSVQIEAGLGERRGTNWGDVYRK